MSALRKEPGIIDKKNSQLPGIRVKLKASPLVIDNVHKVKILQYCRFYIKYYLFSKAFRNPKKDIFTDLSGDS
jgi:hypothetical protein